MEEAKAKDELSELLWLRVSIEEVLVADRVH